MNLPEDYLPSHQNKPPASKNYLKSREFLLFLLYFLLSLYDSLQNYRSTPWMLKLFLKPIIASILMYYLLTNSLKTLSKYVEFIQFGLVFSLLADIAFVFLGSKLSFNVTKIAFFTMAGAKIFYIIAFFSSKNDKYVKGNPDFLFKCILCFPFILFGMLLSFSLTDNLGAYKILVMLYILIMVLMGVGAIMRLNLTSDKSFWLTSIGSIVLMLSNTIIGIQQIYGIKVYSIAVAGQVFYHVANFLVVLGAVDHVGTLERAKSHTKYD